VATLNVYKFCLLLFFYCSLYSIRDLLCSRFISYTVVKTSLNIVFSVKFCLVNCFYFKSFIGGLSSAEAGHATGSLELRRSNYLSGIYFGHFDFSRQTSTHEKYSGVGPHCGRKRAPKRSKSPKTSENRPRKAENERKCGRKSVFFANHAHFARRFTALTCQYVQETLQKHYIYIYPI